MAPVWKVHRFIRRVVARILNTVTTGLKFALVTAAIAAITTSTIAGLALLAHYFGWVDLFGGE